MLAAKRPDLVRGLVLLNATPFWAFRPPRGSPDSRSPLWAALERAVPGSVPVPAVRAHTRAPSDAAARPAPAAHLRARHTPRASGPVPQPVAERPSPPPTTRLSRRCPLLPAAQPLKRTIERLWNSLRSPATVTGMLALVSADKSPPDAPLVGRILEATQQPGALDAFASIVLAPKVGARVSAGDSEYR
jgi:hypothetical protein